MFCTVEEAIEEIRSGRIIIIVDDEERENEGDFVCAAEFVTPEIINFMITQGKGLYVFHSPHNVLQRSSFLNGTI